MTWLIIVSAAVVLILVSHDVIKTNRGLDRRLEAAIKSVRGPEEYRVGGDVRVKEKKSSTSTQSSSHIDPPHTAPKQVVIPNMLREIFWRSSNGQELLSKLDMHAPGASAFFGGVLLYGDDPIENSVLDELIRGLRIPQFLARDSSARGVALVLGASVRSREEIDAALQQRVGKTLRVYSQEMFLSHLVTGESPYLSKGLDHVYMEHARQHPQLAYLYEQGFDWPVLQPVPGGWGKGRFRNRGGEYSLLTACDYRVGKSSRMSAADRRRCLELAYATSDVTELHNPERWGAPESRERLEQMATHLVWNVDQKHRSNSDAYQKAIADWESDLRWLKERYYRGRYRFDWPESCVIRR